MDLSQLLGGAGVVSQSWREAEDATRRSRALELQTAELDRLERLRQEQLRAPMPTAAPIGQFGTLTQKLPATQVPVAQPARAGLQMAAPAVTTAPAPTPTMAPAPAAPTYQLPAFEAGKGLTAPREDISRWEALFATPEQAEASRRIQQIGITTGQKAAGKTGLISQIFSKPSELAMGENIREAANWYSDEGATYLMQNPDLISMAEEDPVSFYNLYMQEKKARGEAAPAPTAAPAPQGDLTGAMIQTESSGRADAVSPKGAVGLMQVMPKTAMDPGYGLPNIFDFASTRGITVDKRNEAAAKQLLANPDLNVAYGQAYMNTMLNRYNGNLDYALAAYNMGPGATDKWIAAGADPAKLPKETRDYIPKVKAAMGQAAPAAPAAGIQIPGAETPIAEPTPIKAESSFYLANPESMTRDMQVAQQQRQEIARLAGMYQRAGMGAQYMEARAKLMELDNGMIYLQGMQGLQEFSLANDPRRLAAVWSEYAGVPVGIQPRSDGKYDVIVNGETAQSGVSAGDISNTARLAFDQTYRQKKAEASAEVNLESFKSMLRTQEEQAKQVSQMVREIAVKRQEGRNQLDVEALKRSGYEVTPTGAGDGTVIVTPPGAGAIPFVFNPTGTTVEVDGVKITSMAAYPITGLPSYGGIQQ